jgi:hypothetical protein
MSNSLSSGTTFDQSRYELEFDERFGAPTLDETHWLPHYVPQWTTPDRSEARYDLANGVITFRIDADQKPWRPEEGELRVSSIQTGTWSGPVGSPDGQHRHAIGQQVRTAQESRRLYTPSTGAVEATLRAEIDPTTMLAFWLIGFEEDSADQSGEICVIELFGNAIGHEASELSLGLKAHHDPRLTVDMVTPRLPIDVSEWHTYGAEWNGSQVRFYVDDDLVHKVNQGIDYPMQLMLGMFEFPRSQQRPPGDYPKNRLRPVSPRLPPEKRD